MGTLKTTNIQTITGSGTLTLGTSGETVSFGSGVTGLNYPAFHVRLSSDMSVTSNTWTTITFDTKDIDTNSVYNTTNYRFTPAISGKYYIYASVYFVGGATGGTNYHQVGFVKNGSTNIGENGVDFRSTLGYGGSAHVYGVMDFNTTDYVTVRGRISSSGSPSVASSRERTVFGGYRIGS